RNDNARRECEDQPGKKWVNGRCVEADKYNCEQDKTKVWVNNQCIDKAQYECEQSGKKWVNGECKESVQPTPVDPNPTPVNPNPTPVDPNPTPVDPNPTPVDPNPTPVDPNPTPVDPVKPELSSLEKCLAEPARQGKPKAIACCYVSKSVAAWDGRECKCADESMEFIVAANGKGGTCKLKNGCVDLQNQVNNLNSYYDSIDNMIKGCRLSVAEAECNKKELNKWLQKVSYNAGSNGIRVKPEYKECDVQVAAYMEQYSVEDVDKCTTKLNAAKKTCNKQCVKSHSEYLETGCICDSNAGLKPILDDAEGKRYCGCSTTEVWNEATKKCEPKSVACDGAKYKDVCFPKSYATAIYNFRTLCQMQRYGHYVCSKKENLASMCSYLKGNVLFAADNYYCDCPSGATDCAKVFLVH
ncbi:MAG: hypothetical protein J5742_04410, partial [Alphaproteobacteria bacterium]|nr:hypothetical protein [Alphaproteobacteria bacterium]